MEALFSELKDKVTDLGVNQEDQSVKGCLTEEVKGKLFGVFTVRRDLFEEALEEQRLFWDKKAKVIRDDHFLVEEAIGATIQDMDEKVKKLILGDTKEPSLAQAY